jgi:hypothetical protein
VRWTLQRAATERCEVDAAQPVLWHGADIVML